MGACYLCLSTASISELGYDVRSSVAGGWARYLARNARNVYLGLSQWGRYEASAKISREVLEDFYIGVKGYESYDSDPATQGAERNDWGLTLTLGLRF